MRRTTYRVRSGLFPIDMPTRLFWAETNTLANGSIEAVVICRHLNPQGRFVREVICKRAGYHRSRSTAYRNAQTALSYVLMDYPSEHITKERINT